MFEVAEVGRKISKAEFKRQEPALHTKLLEVQRQLKDSDIPVIVIVSGVEAAGKGAVVSRLNEWLDARGIRTHAFWDETDEERERPRFWRFWRALPPRGTIGIMFGSWYTEPIISNVFGRSDAGDLDRALTRIASFERMLTADGALIVKFWFHMPKKVQRKRLEEEAAAGGRAGTASSLTKKFSKHYDEFLSVSERAIRTTDTDLSPWYIVEAEDRRYRDLTVGNTLLNAIQARLDDRVAAAPSAPKVATPPAPGAGVTILDRVDLGPALDDKQYRTELATYQRRLRQLVWKARGQKRFTVAVFEGWDAGGKGGAIRRVTAAMDARLYRVISIAAPTDEERAQHYLWRFWRHVPRSGYATIYDRSWYGRVLVERVEGFAKPHEWMRAYQEINEFEEQLCEHGVVLLKFWLHLDQEEQLRRFEERKRTPWKQHKITEEDWRNRERWEDYRTAVNDMVAHTSTEFAPWTLVPGNDKRYARIHVLKTFCRQLKAAL